MRLIRLSGEHRARSTGEGDVRVLFPIRRSELQNLPSKVTASRYSLHHPVQKRRNHSTRSHQVHVVEHAANHTTMDLLPSRRLIGRAQWWSRLQCCKNSTPRAHPGFRSGLTRSYVPQNASSACPMHRLRRRVQLFPWSALVCASARLRSEVTYSTVTSPCSTS